MELQKVVWVDGARSPFARGGRGALVATRLDEAASTVLRALLARNPKVDPRSIEEIGLGNVMGAGELSGLGANHIARLAGLTEEVCTFDTNRQCGSSMEALHRVAQEIMVGAIHTGVAMGVERMGRQLRPGGGDRDRNRVTEFNQKRLQQTPAQRDPAPDHGDQFAVPLPDYILDSTPVVSMTQTAQNVSEVYGPVAAAAGRVRRREPSQVRRGSRRWFLRRRNHPSGSGGAGVRRRGAVATRETR